MSLFRITSPHCGIHRRFNGTASLTYAWDFTNDGITDSTLKNPIYTYLTIGSYTAKLTVAPNTPGSNAVTHIITVTNTTTKIGIYQNGVWNLDLYGNGGKNLRARYISCLG